MGNSPNRENTFLEACRLGNLDVVKECVEDGQNIHANEDLGLCYACACGNMTVVRFIIDYDDKPCNPRALYNAALYGHLDIVKLLVETGVNYRSKGNLALHLARKNNHKDISTYLLEKSRMEDL